MSRNWTAAQSAAMNTRHKTLLVSAAAGSGKTATLTERIIRSITDPNTPADISKMLIVTFTRAAADELKSRIFSALSEELAKNPSDRHLSEQLIKLGSAKICTIDAFYLELLRSNFSTLGLSSSFRIADPVELELLGQTVMEDVIDFFYETDNDFPTLVECFTSTRSTGQLADTLLSLYESAASIPEGIAFFKLCAEMLEKDVQNDFLSSLFGEIISTHTAETAEYCLSVFTEACQYFASDSAFCRALLPSFEYDRSFCERLIDILGQPTPNYEEIQKLLDSFSPVRLGRLKAEEATEQSEDLKALRTKLHTKIRNLKKKFYSHSVEQIQFALTDTAHITHQLYAVLQEYQWRMTEEKKRRNLLDFSDIRRYTLELLVEPDGTPTPIAKRYAEQFSDIYIDEYQDVDRVQDLIFSAISRSDNRFMVGDIKQSIYSFRGAEPQVFAEYRTSFPAHDSEAAKQSDRATIFMSENFRCDENIIRFTNLVCSRIFSVCVESMDYKSADDLVFSKARPYEGYASPKVQVSVLTTATESESTEEEADEEDLPEKQELEAAYIAGEIDRLIRFEKKANGEPILPGDIAVLFRSRAMSSILAQALQARGIQSSESDAEQYFENPDVLMLLCLLNTIDNPHRDIYLTGTLRSLLFDFSMDDLIQIRSGCDDTYSLYDALVAYKENENSLGEKCRKFDDFLTEMREKSTSLPVDRLLRLLFETDLFLSSGLLTSQNSDGNGGNLIRFYEYARTFESGSFKGLYNFIEFINTVIEEDKKMKLPPKGVSPQRVNLMTIHQSKGLEFPVCFVCSAAKTFNRQDVYSTLLFDYPNGIAMKIADQTGFARINTPMREALAIQIENRQIEEEMRVLYVALTRARERLYVTASTAKSEETLLSASRLRAKFCGRHTLLHCRSYLDWILLPFSDASVPSDCAELCFLNASDLTKFSFEPSEQALLSAKEEETDEALRSELAQKYAFRYPYAALRKLPAKISVSKLSPDALDEEDTTAELFPTKKATVPDFFLSSSSSQASAAQRGTATHLFLQFVDFERALRHGIKEEIARLIQMRFIPENFGDLIFEEEMEQFFKSDLIREIQRSQKIIREQRFNVMLSAENFTQDSKFKKVLAREKLAVQGVIDLILLDQDGTPRIYDYKTDRLTREELKNPSLAQEKMNRLHGLQLSYYAHAASILFHQPCDQLFVYSTHAGRLFEIEKKDLLSVTEFLDTL